MNIVNKKIFSYLILFITVGFASCENSSEELPIELTIQNKVELLESNEWLLKDYEDRIMYTFVNGKRYTQYGESSVFFEVIPGKEEYEIIGDQLKIDFNFGHVYTFEIKVSCNNNIVSFFRDGELNTTLYKRGSNYEECL